MSSVQKKVLGNLPNPLFSWSGIRSIEEFAGDDVIVRFREVVVQVPAEWLVKVE